MSQPNGFWEQYKDNLRDHNRQAPWRFLRLIVAFGLTLILAPCCMAAVAITGEPMAAMVVAVVGIVGVFVAWRTMLWMFDRGSYPAPAAAYSSPGFGVMPQSPFAPMAMSGFPPGKSGFETPFPTSAAYTPPAYSPQAPGAPIMGASSGPVPPFAPEPPKTSSGAGCAIAAVAVVGVLVLSCCGGGLALFVALPNLKIQDGPAQPVGGPAGQPFGFPGPMPGMPGAVPNQPFPQNDPFEEMRRTHEKHFEELMKENERRMREFDQQIREQNQPPFPRPGF